MEFKQGIYEDLTYDEYDSIPAYRSHDLTAVIRCPYSWKNKPKMTTGIKPAEPNEEAISTNSLIRSANKPHK